MEPITGIRKRLLMTLVERTFCVLPPRRRVSSDGRETGQRGHRRRDTLSRV